MTVLFYKRLTRNSEIGNIHVWVLPNIWRLGRVRDANFGINISHEMLLNVTKCQGCRFYHFRRGKIIPCPTQIKIKLYFTWTCQKTCLNKPEILSIPIFDLSEMIAKTASKATFSTFWKRKSSNFMLKLWKKPDSYENCQKIKLLEFWWEFKAKRYFQRQSFTNIWDKL